MFNKQKRDLDKLSKDSGSISEHIRRAIDEYLVKRMKKEVSFSPSSRGVNKNA